MKQPRVSKRERKLHLSYELPHRIHSSLLYPISAPNGSTLIIYGHDRGLKALWRGGRRRCETPRASAPRTNGTQHTDVILIDDSDDEGHADEPVEDQFEKEEEELDPDCPYPSAIQDLDIRLDRSVLHVAAPPLQTSALTPAILKKVAVVAITSSDGSVRLLQIPLSPPSDEQKGQTLQDVSDSKIVLHPSGGIISDLSAKYLPIDNQPLTAPKRQQEDVEGHLLVAAASRALSIWSISVTADNLFVEDQRPTHKVQLANSLCKISFHPSTRSAQLLVGDRLGAARIYDPYAFRTPQKRPDSSGSATEPNPNLGDPGIWIMTYHTTFALPKDGSLPAALTRRKRLLDAKWVLGGKGILALLEDSQWGVWDVSGTSRPARLVEAFAIDGFLTSPSANEPVEPVRPKRGSSKLAPMTPNTRKSKSEQFYSGDSKSKLSEAVAKGGISVATNHPRSGQSDESVILWHNSDVYTIPSMQSFWQRSTTSGGIGSLYAPGISHVTELDPMHEIISSISLFATKSSSAGIGAMNTQRDLLVSTEYHIIVLQQLRAQTTARSLFQAAERPASRDQQMLDAGALDLAGMDRVLDGMAAGGGPARKVGFAT
ncbi:hypothetical protein M409DRAFT_66740 [Zasmidium cellare ATCC 36951]|uniref:Uncharacterized protein n=1 Tax=Zasmidium cellare ATCC 36951 TaxID=1080233 RepID=A0A6A6CKM6_ZASCE|nr:uncharacterized protein M409DRAFT_66740 [Zasmidium cellare ATCC 36951]KAF2166269.1 hypothetical protein M409DRAFT_66740 [Zasmidium cellare ATCC 36951]